MAGLEKREYFDYPNSLDPLTPVFKTGLIPVAIFSVLSLISVTALLAFITHRLISWRSHYREYVGYNQYIILIYNLLLADLQQAMAFAITFHWLRIDKIVAPTAPCFIQAWFLHIGDVASGFFVLAIAIHTWLGVVKGYKPPYLGFVAAIIGIWVAAVTLTIVGPLMHRERFFAQAGGWCWVSMDFEPERLWLHYLWIFIVEFGTIAIYGHVFIHLRGRLRSVISTDTRKLSRATKFMILYPLVYVLLTLPIAVGRMVAMTGRAMPDLFFCVAGSFLVSSGWLDSLLYCYTRRVLVHGNELSANGGRTVTAVTANAVRPGDELDFGLQSMNKSDVETVRTVTITGGTHRLSRIVDHRRGRSHGRSNARSGHWSPTSRDSSPTGSTDSIIKLPNAIGIVTETNIHIESCPNLAESDRDSETLSSKVDSRSQSRTEFSPPSS